MGEGSEDADGAVEMDVEADALGDPAAPEPSVDLDETPLTAGVVAEVRRLTRHARDAVTEEEAAAARERRAELLGDYGYRARVREDDDTLVLYPGDWLTDGTVDVAAIEALERAVELPLSGAGESDRYVDVSARNDAVARRVADEHGPVHGANATAFATFMSNHHARWMEAAGRREIEEFRRDYFPRNAWPSDAQRAAVGESIRLVFVAAGEEPPAWLDETAPEEDDTA